MTENSKIGWTHHTLNAWIGCTKIGKKCANCYADRDNKRRRWVPGWGKGQPRRMTTDATWLKYRTWAVRAYDEGSTELVFCGSLMDWCDEEAPEGGLERIWKAWDETRPGPDGPPPIIWLMLTYRGERIPECLPPDWSPERYPHVALGLSIGDRGDLEMMDAFCAIPAAYRFISYEPALEWCELRPWLHGPMSHCPDDVEDENGVSGCAGCDGSGRRPGSDCNAVMLPGPIHQVIIGGESGPKARPFNIQWARDTVRDCKAAGVRVFVKQMGAAPYSFPYQGQNLSAPLRFAGKGEDPAEWPEDLRVQERIIDTEAA